jgi:hypothetical protein
MARAARAPAGASRSALLAAVTASIEDKSMTPKTNRIAVKPEQQ